MLVRSLLEYLLPRAGSRQAPRAKTRPRNCRLAVEALEDRLTPAGAFTIGNAAIVEGNTGTLNALVPVTLSGSHGNNVTVDYQTADGTAADGSDYAAVSGRLTFNKNETTKSIVIPILGDRLIESGEQFSVRLSNAKGARIADGSAVVTITDNEPRVGISDASAWEDLSGQATMNLAVKLQAAYDVPVTIHYDMSGGTATPGDDYAAASGTVTFAPGETLQLIPITVNDDRVVETDETIQVTLTTADSYVTITDSVGIGTIFDNEPHINIADAYQDYYGGTITFFVWLEVPYDEVVTVDFYTWDGSAIAGVDYVSTSGTLTFNPGEETVLMITVELLSTEPADKYLYVELSNPSANAVLDYYFAVGLWYYDYEYSYYGW